MTNGEAGRGYRLLGADGAGFFSATRGTLGGNRRLRIYGRLDCPTALRWIARGHYAAHRVFFADEATAIAAGFRPCAVCLPAAYRRYRQQGETPGVRARAGRRAEGQSLTRRP